MDGNDLSVFFIRRSDVFDELSADCVVLVPFCTSLNRDVGIAAAVPVVFDTLTSVVVE